MDLRAARARSPGSGSWRSRQLAQVQFAQQPGELLGERAETVPLFLLEVRFQGLGGQARIIAAVLAALQGLADGLLQRKFQRVPVVVGDRKEKAVSPAVMASE
jgi:hypothetical protein